jgi:glycerophosphoryl diester phosphodiesterase
VTGGLRRARHLAVAAALFGVGVATSGDAGHSRENARILVVAYRGGEDPGPENSLRALRGASALDVNYVQLDVHVSRDGEIVVIHDPTLDRTTTGTGPVRDRRMPELRALRLKLSTGVVTDESVPTLSQALEIAAREGLQLLIEIKAGPDQARYPGIEDKLVSLLDRHRMARAAIVLAREPETRQRVRALRPTLRTGVRHVPRAGESPQSVSSALDEAVRSGAVLFWLPPSLLTPAVLAQARQSGVYLAVGPVSDAPALRRAIEVGADLVISGRPDLARSLTRGGP